MNAKETVGRYPRLTRVLLAIGGETDSIDLSWAAEVIDMSKTNKQSFAHSLVKEAWLLRHQYVRDVEAKRIVSEFLDIGESIPQSSPINTYF